MKNWCKVIEVLDEAVLFYMEPETREDELECECLHQVVRTQGVCADVKIGGIPCSLAEEVFNNIDQETAEQVIKTVEDLLEQ